MTTGLRKSPEPVFAACYCHRTGGTRILRRAATLGSSSMTEQLTFIVYASRAVEPFDHDDLVDLLSQSRENNSRDGITGMLVYRDLDFIQILEGPDAAVRALLERIGRDPRVQRGRTELRQRHAVAALDVELRGAGQQLVRQALRDHRNRCLVGVLAGVLHDCLDGRCLSG